MADWSVNDRRSGSGGQRRSANSTFDATMRRAGATVHRATERERTRIPYGDPRAAEIYQHLGDRRVSQGRGMRRTAALGTGTSLQMATQRPRDPMWNWKQNNIPVNFTEPEELKRIREFCNTPDAPIMMADGTSKPIGEVQVGDQVMGWNYIELWNGGMHRRYQATTVLATSTRIAPNVVQLNMSSGMQVKCTADHRWHNPYWTKPQSNNGGLYPTDWSAMVARQTTEYAPAHVGSDLLAPTNIRFIENPGNIFTSSYPGMISISDQQIDTVVSIDEIGEAEVVSLQTETGNYIAWGYCSKNCRLLYATHPIVSACIDVYSKLPMQGLHFECLAGETRVWTEHGLKPIATLTGEVHRILTTGGKWVEGKFESYGYRPLRKVTVQRNGRTKELHATVGHRWFVYRGQDKERKREVVTTELEPGMRLVSSYARNIIGKTAPSPFGIAHGFTYGDGTLATWGGGSVVDLHGEKDAALLPYFQLCTQQVYPRPEHTKSAPVKVSHLPAFFKRLPPADEGVAYLYGWLAGYFAADGTVSKKGECFLDSVDRASIEFAELVCQRLGIKTYEPYEITVPRTVTPQGREYLDRTMYRLPIDPASLIDAFFVISEHRDRWTSDRKRVGEWTVVSVEDTNRVEMVYCATVPGTEAFTIEGNILTGNCKDPQLVDFYSELFFDQLGYEDHLLKLGRQYWLAGEGWSLGGWNETLGIWEEDQLINPDDVEVEKSLFLKDPRYLMRLPESLRRILTTRQPFWQYSQLVQQFPELVAYASEDALIPVSNIVLKQLRFEADDFSNRGIPILMRAMRTLIQEEMLNSALDSIADRLYTPLILTKLGARADELGTEVPWIPSQDDMDEFNAALDAALAADFRALTYHWAIDMQPVFGRENVPDLSNDFDRIVERILMVFGLSQTMLTGASAGETYAADALNRDVVTQLLSHYQKMLSRFVYDRAAIVAEAQGHFDYDVRGGMRYLQTEEIYEVDEETGEGRIVEVPKLLVPELKYKVLNLSDEEQERQFVETLAEAGVPVPYRARLQSAGIDFEEALEQRSQEAVDLAVEEQRTRKKTYLALKREGLPIPQDLREDFDPKAQQPGGMMPQMPGEDQPLPGMTPEDLPALAPTPDELMGEDDAENQDASDAAEGTPFGADQDPEGEDPNEGQDVDEDGDPKNRPEESDEERGDMPKKTGGLSKEAVKHNAAVQRFGRREVLDATSRHFREPDNSQEERVQDHQPTGRFGPPRTAGMRRFVHIPEQLRAAREEEDVD